MKPVWQCWAMFEDVKVAFRRSTSQTQPQKQEELYLLTLSSSSASYLSLTDSIQNIFRKAK